MTNQEAITLLDGCRRPLPLSSEIDEAIIMAINALSAIDNIKQEIETIIGERNLDDYDFCSGLICARKIIDKHLKKGDSE